MNWRRSRALFIPDNSDRALPLPVIRDRACLCQGQVCTLDRKRTSFPVFSPEDLAADGEAAGPEEPPDSSRGRVFPQ